VRTTSKLPQLLTTHVDKELDGEEGEVAIKVLEEILEVVLRVEDEVLLSLGWDRHRGGGDEPEHSVTEVNTDRLQLRQTPQEFRSREEAVLEARLQEVVVNCQDVVDSLYSLRLEVTMR